MSKKNVIRVSFLSKWGKGRDFGSEPLRLNVCSVITDRNKFFESHITLLEAGAKRDRKSNLMPYYHRLVRFYQLIENETNETTKDTKPN